MLTKCMCVYVYEFVFFCVNLWVWMFVFCVFVCFCICLFMIVYQSLIMCLFYEVFEVIFIITSVKMCGLVGVLEYLIYINAYLYHCPCVSLFIFFEYIFYVCLAKSACVSICVSMFNCLCLWVCVCVHHFVCFLG